ncbi:hypothetical protein AJ78_06891 [Emergomyces pasteurianus Ep9510]|uniref:Uncharacterized protein n=1 Tax=Emergomyces pasteurianus Ep9510 TaxID=1447872 RepID=A0A1J9P8Y2_9EURO|nr:hypothetical protein AJ78_06891 [Emergomyces pasteurianus Ep9510]
MTQAVDFRPVNKRLMHDQDMRLFKKPVQRVEDNMIMFNMTDFCALFNNIDDNYCASSEENDSVKSSLKHYRLFIQSFNTILRAAVIAGREDIKQKDRKM